MSLSRWILILWIGVISGVTLVPFEVTEQVPPILCMLCGYAGAADAVLNVALFLPLGVALTLDGWRPLGALAIGSMLSLGIETAQLIIPGRDSSISDLLCNTIGTALGIAITWSAPIWWRPDSRTAKVLSVYGALAVTSVLSLTAALLAPSFPEEAYYGGWTPRFGHLEWYDGRVLGASIGGLEIPDGAIAHSGQVRQQLLSQPTIVVNGLAGPRVSGLAPLLTIHDLHQREMLLLGVDGTDFVYRYRTRSIAWRFAAPEIRIRGALGAVPQDAALSITVRRVSAGYCVAINAMERCGLGYTMGRGWALLLGRQAVPLWLQAVLPIAWIATLFFPIGLWARLSWAGSVAVVLAPTSLLVLPAPSGLLPTPPAEVVGAVVGLTTGWVSRRVPLKSSDP